MADQFDVDQSRRFLAQKEIDKKEKREEERKVVLALAIRSLTDLFQGTGVEVFLVGSITQPHLFHSHSDVDIVLKNFAGDRFEVWTKLESMLHRNVEIILFEHCPFQEHVLRNGYRVF